MMENNDIFEKKDDQTPQGQCSTNTSGCGCGCGLPKGWIFMMFGIVLVVILFNQSSSSPGVQWQNDLKAGLEQAKAEDKPVLLSFSASWCGYCDKMKKKVYNNEEVLKLSENFIPVQLDYDINKEEVQNYKVDGVPDYFVLGADGTVVSHFTGYREAQDFADKLKNALTKSEKKE
ncbi:MAG: thioredoxin family protein [Phycisphaerae bacterium]|nr:thioredoxin family protein [Phycisphaerae bacterium]